MKNFKVRENLAKRGLYLLPAAVGIATAMSLVACTSQQPKTQTFSQAAAQALVKEGKTKEAAEHYARLGELLLLPEGFTYADEMFQKALELDPSNSKALLYKAETEPMMVLKGFIPRIERLVSDEHDSRELERLRESIAWYKMPELTKFSNELAQGEAALASYYDFQRFLREKLLPAALASVDKLSRVDTSKPIVLNVTPDRFSPDSSRTNYYSSNYSTYCYYNQPTGWNCTSNSNYYNYEAPKLRNEYTLDAQDVKILKDSWIAIAGQIRLSTAYSLKDSEYAIRRLKAISALRLESGLRMTSRDVVETLRGFNDLLTLEKDHQVSELARSADPLLRDTLELDSLKDSVCNNSGRNETNALFTSLCLSADVVDKLKLGLDLLAGPKEIELGRNAAGKPVLIVMDVTRILKNPPKDLKALLPSTFDAMGEPTAFPDATMGGLFPNGDFIQKLKEMGTLKKSVQVSSGIGEAVRSLKDHL